MANLFASLNTASEALQAFERSIAVSQNNVTNASTPGFVRQDPVLIALPFQSSENLVGGVRAGLPQDSRNQFAEQSVRNQVAASGFYSQLTASLGQLESVFDVSGKTGIPAALNQLFQSFSAWSATPDSASARQAVLVAAQGVADTFKQASQQVANVRTGVERDLGSTAAQINALAAKIRSYNVARRQSAEADPAADAGLHDSLESLSRLVDINPLFQADGTVTVLLGGQTPLVIGDQQNSIRVSYSNPAGAANPNAPPSAHILNGDNADITGQITGGKLGALLQARNLDIPSLEGDATHAGSLNLLAKQVADRINQLLTAGQVTANPPTSGVALFTYDPNNAVTSASSLALNPQVSASKLAAIDPGPPAVSNGIALKLAGLAQSTAPADQIQGATYLDFFASLATQVGNRVSTAKDSATRSSDLEAQAKSFRAQLSGVSLDQEAVRLVELQRAYQAAARVVSIVDELTATVVGLIK